MMRLFWCILAALLVLPLAYWCNIDITQRDPSNFMLILFMGMAMVLVLLYPDNLPGEK